VLNAGLSGLPAERGERPNTDKWQSLVRRLERKAPMELGLVLILHFSSSIRLSTRAITSTDASSKQKSSL
jgi:hypothetical protein